MDIEEIKRRAELYSALAEGKTIQVNNMNGEWDDVEPKKLNYIPDELVFRIKPESKYRPFRTQEECWEEMLKHQPFGWIKSKDNTEVVQIGRLVKAGGCGCLITLSIDEGRNIAPSYYYNNYTFTDGTPFGINEEKP